MMTRKRQGGDPVRSGTTFLKGFDVSAARERASTFEPQLAQSTIRMQQMGQQIFECLVDLWLAEHSEPGQPTNYHEYAHAGGSYQLPREFWVTVALACCRPTLEHAEADIERTGDLIERPVAVVTALRRFRSAIGAHNRLRPTAGVPIEWSKAGGSMIRDSETVEQHKLQPLRDNTEKFATLQNVIDFGAATLHPDIDWQSTRERLQVQTFVPLLFLTSSRPSDFLSTKDALSAAKKARSEKSKPVVHTTVWGHYRFFFGIGADGKICPGVLISIRPSKTKAAKPRQEQILADPALPAACELVYLLLALALLDGVLDPLTAEQLDGRHVKLSDLNRATRRLDMAETPRSKKELPVFRMIEKDGPGRFKTSRETADIQAIRRGFDKVRPFCCFSLDMYDLRRGGSATLSHPDVKEIDANLGLSHAPHSLIRRQHYDTMATGLDRVGLSLGRDPNPSIARHTGNPDGELLKLTPQQEYALSQDAEIVAAEKVVDHARAAAQALGRQATETDEHKRYATLRMKLWHLKRKKRLQLQQQLTRERAEVDALRPLLRRSSSPEQEDSSPLIAAKFGSILEARPPREKGDLESVHEELAKTINVDQEPILALLRVGEEKVTFSSAFAVLTDEESVNPTKCPVCTKALNGYPSNKKIHIHDCARAKIKKVLRDKYDAAIMADSCLFKDCDVKTSEIINNTAARKHVRKHVSSLAECGMPDEEGDACDWADMTSAVELTSLDAALLAAHRQVRHNLPTFYDLMDSYYYDSERREWVIGFCQVQHRCALKLAQPGELLITTRRITPSQCAFCLVNEDLPPSERVHEYQRGKGVAEHLVQHFIQKDGKYSESDESVTCPCCGDTIFVWTVLEHFEKLGVTMRDHKAREDADLLDAFHSCKAMGFDAWLKFVKERKAKHLASSTSHDRDEGQQTSQDAISSASGGEQDTNGINNDITSPDTEQEERNLFKEIPEAAAPSAASLQALGARNVPNTLERSTNSSEEASMRALLDQSDRWQALLSASEAAFETEDASFEEGEGWGGEVGEASAFGMEGLDFGGGQDHFGVADGADWGAMGAPLVTDERDDEATAAPMTKKRARVADLRGDEYGQGSESVGTSSSAAGPAIMTESMARAAGLRGVGAVGEGSGSGGASSGSSGGKRSNTRASARTSTRSSSRTSGLTDRSTSGRPSRRR